MDEARARRLQPHYIEQAFTAAFTRLGGKLTRREQGRFEIRNVPARLRTIIDRPIASRYERVCFDLAHIQPDGLTSNSRSPLAMPSTTPSVTHHRRRHYDTGFVAGTVLKAPCHRPAPPGRLWPG